MKILCILSVLRITRRSPCFWSQELPTDYGCLYYISFPECNKVVGNDGYYWYPRCALKDFGPISRFLFQLEVED
ncbi:hypothetical protein MKW98_013636 [Papaver atlanticum]|uniref:Uncharacterized protein n=1 Tax=Papaver atlanticum TaxID=357466 RepID=A0AAD4RYH6_9MAGN|nr:hypothetical protein MKW98_013636 [Papaver atlanticum]